MKFKELAIGMLILLILFILFDVFNDKKVEHFDNVICEKYSEALSYKAMQVDKSGGASTGFSYHLILSRNKIIDDNSHTVFVSNKDFDYYWESEKLIVIIDDEIEIFKQETEYDDIQIIYKYVD